jgi:hypothetical protein
MELFQQIDARSFTHRVDARGRICFVNTAWLDFAAENGWPVTAADILGRPLMAFIGDEQLRYLYGLLMTRLRGGRGPFRFPFRCDAPDCRRFMRMDMRYDPLPREVEFQSQVVRIERRFAQPLLDPEHPVEQTELALCSCCKRVSTDHGWVELEDAVIQLRLLDCDRIPRTRHSVCQTCSAQLAALARQG